MSPLNAPVRIMDGTIIAAVEGAVDMATVSALVQRLEYAVAAEPDRIIVDLAATSFMDSSGLHAIAHAANVLPVRSALVVR